MLAVRYRYILLRDAMLGPRAWDALNTGTQGDYECIQLVKLFNKLERPVPGSGKPLEGAP